MAMHSSILDWRIPWTEETGGLQYMGLQRVGHDWSDLAHMLRNISYKDWKTMSNSNNSNTKLACTDAYPVLSQFSPSVVSDSLQPHESQHARPPCLSPTPRVYSNPRPLSWWCHATISSSVIPFSSAPNPSQHQGLFQWVNSSHEVAEVLEFQLQHQSFQWTPRTDLL